MPGLPTYATISYNGLIFPNAVHLSMKAEAVEDESHRTIVYRRYSVNVDTIFVKEDVGIFSDMDDAAQVLRSTLLQPGKELILTGAGVGGDITVNSQNDMEFGPKPRFLSFQIIGQNQAIRVNWECTFTVLECNYSNPFGQFSFAINFDITAEGLTNITMSGVGEVYVRRVAGSNRQYEGTADSFRDYIAFPLADGYRRSQQYNLSPDRRFLHFTIRDEEIPSDNPYFPGMVRMDVTHRVRSAKLPVAGLWNCDISGTITVAPHYPRSYAWVAFLIVLKSRLHYTKMYASTGNAFNNEAQAKKWKPGLLLVTSLSLEEEVYGRSLRMDISYTMFTSLKTLLRASGLWQPVNNDAANAPQPNIADAAAPPLPAYGSWQAWKTSVQAVHRPRGVNEIRHDPNQEAIVNFCSEPPITGSDLYKFPKPEASLANEGNCPEDPDQSWQDFHCQVYVFRKSNVIYHTPLGANDVESPLNVQMGRKGATIDVPHNGSTQGQDITTHVAQIRGISTITVVLTGYGTRLGHPIRQEELPVISTVGGAKAKEIDTALMPSTVVGYVLGGCPLYRSAWRRTYRLEQNENTSTELTEQMPYQIHPDKDDPDTVNWPNS